MADDSAPRLVLLPGALLDARYVTWTSIDERRAAATLSAPGVVVTGTFEFGANGLPCSFSAQRYLDTRRRAAVALVGRLCGLPLGGRTARSTPLQGLLAPRWATHPVRGL